MAGRDLDRRAIFFWLSSLVVFALIPLTPAEFRWVGITLAIALVVLGGASLLDYLTSRRTHR